MKESYKLLSEQYIKIYNNLTEEQKKKQDLIKLYAEERELRYELDFKLSVEKQKTLELIKYLEDKIKECNEKIENYEKWQQKGMETDIEYYECIINDNLLKSYQEILDRVKEK